MEHSGSFPHIKMVMEAFQAPCKRATEYLQILSVNNQKHIRDSCGMAADESHRLWINALL